MSKGDILGGDLKWWSGGAYMNVNWTCKNFLGWQQRLQILLCRRLICHHFCHHWFRWPVWTGSKPLFWNKNALRRKGVVWVDGTGFEPVTSAVWKQRSKPTELTVRGESKYRKAIEYCQVVLDERPLTLVDERRKKLLSIKFNPGTESGMILKISSLWTSPKCWAQL